MTTHTIKGFLYHVQYDWQKANEFQVVFSDTKGMETADPDWTLIRAHEITVDVPDDFDPRPHKIAALREQQNKVRAEMLKKINDLQEQINKLSAIEYVEPESVL